MKRKLVIATALLFFPALLMAQSRQNDFTLRTADGPLQGVQDIRAGGDIEIFVDVRIPEDHHIYISHVDTFSMNILTEFSLPVDSGWSVEVFETPAGERYDGDIILRGKGRNEIAGTYRLLLSETAGRNVARRAHNVPIELRTQMCDSKTNICFRPSEFQYSVRLRVTEARAEPEVIFRSSSTINWQSSRSTALQQAQSSGQNILVLITATWCGPCQRLERDILSKKETGDFLNQGFVALKVDSEQRDELRNFEFRGYPTLIVLNSEGKELTRSVSRGGVDAFQSSLARFATRPGSAASGSPPARHSVAIDTNSRMEQTPNGKWQLIRGNDRREYDEIRRDEWWAIVFDQSEYLAVPVTNRGKVQRYTNGEWVEYRP